MRLLLIAIMALSSALSAPSAGAAELIMFEEPGCVWCRRWHAEIGPGYPHSREGRLAPLHRRDIRDGTPTGVRFERSVVSTPTFVLVDGGEEKGRITGYPGEDFFYPLLDKLLERLALPSPAGETQMQRETRVRDSGIIR